MIALQRALSKLNARATHRISRKPLRSQRQSRRYNSTKENESSQGLSKNTSEVKASENKPDPVDIPVSLWYKRLGPVTDFFSWFHKTQGKRPLTVQLCTTLVTYLCGDLLAQDLGGEPYDPLRTLRMLTIGAVASIPGYKWFLWLGEHFNYSSKALSIATKVCVQQAVFTPTFNTYFFGMQAVLTGESPSGVIERIKATVPISMLNSLKLWPAVTAFSFAFIPAEYRFMFSGIFAVCWQGYLSFLNRKEEKEERVGLNTVRALSQLNEEAKQKVEEAKEIAKDTAKEVKKKVKEVGS